MTSSAPASMTSLQAGDDVVDRPGHGDRTDVAQPEVAVDAPECVGGAPATALGVVVDRHVDPLGDPEPGGSRSAAASASRTVPTWLANAVVVWEPAPKNPFAHRAAHGRRVGAADPDRRPRTLTRLGLHRRVDEPPEATVGVDPLLRPQSLHQRQALVEPGDVLAGSTPNAANWR